MRISVLMILSSLLMAAGARAADAPAFKDKFVEANGIKTHYVTTGSGQMMLFLHGFPAYWYMWRDQLTEFGKTHMAVAPDTTGVNTTAKASNLDGYKVTKLVADIHAFAEKVGGKGKKFILVGHDWGGVLAWSYAMYHPEMLDKLVIINAPHPVLFERELRENPIQRAGSSYMFAFNNFDGYKWDERMSQDKWAGLAGGILGGAVKAGVYTQDDVNKWIASWSIPGSVDAGLNYYRANHLNPPFSDQHPASSIPTSYSAKETLAGVPSTTITLPTLVIWGLVDSALQGGNLSGIEKYLPNAKFKFYPTSDHWVSIVKAKEVNEDIRAFIAPKAREQEAGLRPDAPPATKQAAK